MFEDHLLWTWWLGFAMIVATTLLGFGACRLVEVVSTSFKELGAYNTLRNWWRSVCTGAEFVMFLALAISIVVVILALCAMIPWAVGTGGLRLWEAIT